MNAFIRQLIGLNDDDFAERHSFTTKLRLVIFISFLLLIPIFFPDLLWGPVRAMFWVSVAFLITTLSYFIRQFVNQSYLLFVFELAIDIATHTILIAITGGVHSKLFIIYIVYVIVTGQFFNWRVSTIASGLSLIFYLIMTLLLSNGWVATYNLLIQNSYWFVMPDVPGLIFFAVQLIIFSTLIYGTYLSGLFDGKREKILEQRNRELLVLNRVSSTIRSAISLERVTSEVLAHLTRSLGYKAAFLLMVDEKQERMRIIVEEGAITRQIVSALGIEIESIFLPMDDYTNPIYQAMKMKRRRPFLRSYLAEIVQGCQPYIDPRLARRLQDQLGVKKLIVAPMVAERRLVGGIIALSEQSWIGDEEILTFGRYANQAALAIDNAVLIEALRSKNIELERVSEVKSEFLATMSHELRTPLTAIIGFTELLLEGVLGELSQEQNESLNEVLANAENLLQLINSLLDLSKIEAGKMEMHWGPVDLVEMLESIQRTVAPLLKKKGHTLTIHSSPDMPIVMADERKLQQTLLNLVSNAIKFTPSDGKIEMEALFHQNAINVKGWPEVYTHFEQPLVEIQVRDNGIGIAQEDIESIFESFQQVDGSFTRHYQGTGLGLSLSRQFIHMHRGLIRAESQVGDGAVFRVVLPVQAQDILLES